MSKSKNGLRGSRFLSLAALLTAGAVSMTGCVGSAADKGSATKDEKIVIGAAVALSGDMYSYDAPSMDMLRLYVDEMNSKGGIRGQEIKLLEADTKSESAGGTVAAQQVLDQGAEIVVVSCDFDYGSPAATTAISAKKLVVSLCAGSPLFGPEGLGDLAFTMGSAARASAEAAALWAYEKKSWRNVYLLSDDGNQFREQYAAAFTEAWEKLGGTIAGTSTMKSTDTSFDSQVAGIKAAKPDAIVTSAWEVGGPTAIRQIRAAGIDIPIIGSINLEADGWVDAVPGLKDFYFTRIASTSGDDPRPAVNDLYEAYKKKFDKDPYWSYAYLGYALGETVAAAIEGTSGDLSGEALSAWLSTNSVETVIGTVTFTPEVHVDQTRDEQIAVHENGQTNYVDTVKYTSMPK